MLGFILAVGTTIYSAYRAKDSGDKQAKQAEYNAENRKKVAENAAEQERMNRRAESRIERQDARRARARRELQMSASGTLMDGTALSFLAESAAYDEYNSQQGDRVSEARQKGLDVQAKNDYILGRNTANAYAAQGKSQMIQGFTRAASNGYASAEKYGWLD